MIRTRFAPSPTGELHIGNARSALFAFLFARHSEGKFFLRIEDTDRERFVEGATERIVENLKWLGMNFDNESELMIQSGRLPIYRKHAEQLVNEGKAYICTCSKEKLAEARAQSEKSGQPFRYPGFCREAGIKFSDTKEGEFVVRMKMPQSGKVVVDDIIRGKVEFDYSLLDDQILLKSDGYPTYHLAVIVDDHEMEVTHVLRAEEWLSSTPKHLVLYQMFGWEAPQYGHLPIILAPDRTKLSKRHGATSVTEFRKLGYLPEALVNYMALLGWNPKDNREFFTLEELAAEFKIENVNKSPAIFDIVKLNSINEHYIVLGIKNEELRIKNILTQEFEIEPTQGELDLIGRGGFSTLKQAADYILTLRKEPEYEASALIFRKSDREKTLKGLQEIELRIKNYEVWENTELQLLLESVVKETGLDNGSVFWPVRVALSGEEKSPSPVELMVALGKEESLKRIEKAIGKISNGSTLLTTSF